MGCKINHRSQGSKIYIICIYIYLYIDVRQRSLVWNRWMHRNFNYSPRGILRVLCGRKHDRRIIKRTCYCWRNKILAVNPKFSTDQTEIHTAKHCMLGVGFQPQKPPKMAACKPEGCRSQLNYFIVWYSGLI